MNATSAEDIARLLMRHYPPSPPRPGVRIAVFRNRGGWAIDHQTRDSAGIMGEVLDFDEACEVARIIAGALGVECSLPSPATVLPFLSPPVDEPPADPDPPADMPA